MCSCWGGHRKFLGLHEAEGRVLPAHHIEVEGQRGGDAGQDSKEYHFARSILLLDSKLIEADLFTQVAT
jgi:hypothetical protein